MKKFMGKWPLPLFAVGMLVFAIYHDVGTMEPDKPVAPPESIES